MALRPRPNEARDSRAERHQRHVVGGAAGVTQPVVGGQSHGDRHTPAGKKPLEVRIYGKLQHASKISYI